MTESPIYLDYNASTPVHPRVVERMTEFLSDSFGNPSSIHKRGREANRQLSEARETIARALNARPKEIIFTCGGTEADNMAVTGVARAMARQGRGRHVVTSAIEHNAILKSASALEKEGFDVSIVDVESSGVVSVEAIEEALRPDTVLISLMMANNETGAINPIAEVVEVAHHHDIPVHTDAVQAFGKIPVDVEELGVDLLSLSAHKVYGPKGAGCLFIREGTPFEPIMWGGSHERGMRAGTECGPALIGFAKAVELILEDGGEPERMTRLRNRLLDRIRDRIPDVHWNGPGPDRTVPNTLNLGFPGIDGESLLLNLDLEGLCVSGGSACASGAVEPSHVLQAMGLDDDVARASIRCSLGRCTDEDQIDRAADIICRVVLKQRNTAESKAPSASSRKETVGS